MKEKVISDKLVEYRQKFGTNIEHITLSKYVLLKRDKQLLAERNFKKETRTDDDEITKTGFEGGLVGKVLAMKARGPELRYPPPT